MIKNWADVITQRGNVGTIMLFMFTFSLSTYAQDLMWEQTSMPYRGQINAILATPDGNIYAGTHGGIFRSEDGGDTWLNLGLRETFISSFVALGATLYVGIRVATGEGVLRSDDRGKNWISTGLTDFGISSLAVMDQTLFAGTYNVGVFRSEDGGDTWTTANQGLTNFAIGALAVMGTTLYAGTGEGDGGGVFRSDDRGNTWVKTGLADVNIISLAVMNTTLFASSYQGEFFLGVFRSEDGGKTWTEANIGLSSLRITSFVVSGATIFAGGGGVFCSENGGHSWVTMRLAKGVGSLAISGETLYAGTFNDGLFRTDAKCGPRSIPEDMSKDNIWLESGLVNRNVSAFAVLSRALFAGTYGAGIFRSEDGGKTWAKTWVKTGLSSHNVSSLAVMDQTLYAGTLDDGAFRSEDGGKTWTKINGGLTNSKVLSLAVFGNTLFAGTDWKGGIFLSEDGGDSWSNKLWDLSVFAFAALDKTLFAGTDDGIYRSEDGGNSWTPVTRGPFDRVLSLVVLGKTIFAGSYITGVYRSEDGGDRWVKVGPKKALKEPEEVSEEPITVTSLAVMKAAIFAGTNGEGVFRSEDGGNTWVNTGLANFWVYSLGVMDNRVFAGTNGGGVSRASLNVIPAVNPHEKGFLAWGQLKQNALGQNFPNPFNTETWIPYQLSISSEATITIYNAIGSIVKRIELGYKEAGVYRTPSRAVYWDGRNESGELVASGVYFVELKLKTKDYQQIRRMVLIR